MKSEGNTILITGGGSGIGQALAHRLHDAGNHVIIAGRRLDVLSRAAEGRSRMTPIQFDLDDATSIEAFAKRVIAEHPALNVLINNAGIMRFEALERRRDLADAESTVVTNLLGPIRLTNALIDHHLTKRDASIVNVTSGLAFVPLVIAPTYNASKAAIHSYTVSMREALKGKIDVIEVIPPQVKTGLTPGQEEREGVPLDEFADDVVMQLCSEPSKAEIMVQYSQYARHAEADGRFDEVFAMINGR
jgi:uncharacterized oxidoreductase